MTGTKLVFQILLAFVALYPIVTGARWIAGGFIFRLFDERNAGEEPEGGWPGVIGAGASAQVRMNLDDDPNKVGVCREDRHSVTGLCPTR